jgi:hypothetical protein
MQSAGPAFYVDVDEKEQIVWLGVIIPSLGGIITQSFTFAKWKEWEEQNIPRINRQHISSAWLGWDDWVDELGI